MADEDIARRHELIKDLVDERARRLMLGAEARVLGRGGIGRVAEATGAHPDTVARGVREVEAQQPPDGRIRRVGAGRKRLVDTDPDLLQALEALVEPESRGDPMRPLRWTTKSTRNLAGELAKAGQVVSHQRVAEMLGDELGYSLQGNAKTLEGKQHPDRDAQFRFINDQVAAYLTAGDPVISVDAKKKELIGEFHHTGRTWRPTGDPVEVNTHDFPDKEQGKVLPYGVYDVGANAGWVNVGVDHDTAAFAVQTIRRWWTSVGKTAYPQTRRLLVCADAGDSNGYRLRAWKRELAALAEQTGIVIQVAHMPPGTSKWNRIEHRLFSAISSNWRGEPLTSREVAVNLIGATTTHTGLSVHAELDEGHYPTGERISDREMRALKDRHVRPLEFHGDWNYEIIPGDTPTKT